MLMCFDFYPEKGGWLSTECILVIAFVSLRNVLVVVVLAVKIVVYYKAVAHIKKHNVIEDRT